MFKYRKSVVLLRGSVPCEVLFIGEAPGISEDLLGKPFIGPAGKNLDKWLGAVDYSKIRYAITNLIACIPKDDNGKAAEPPSWAIKKCSPRLREVVRLCKPGVIVCIGKHASKYCPTVLEKVYRGEYYDIIHPAAIMRMHPVQASTAIRRNLIVLEDVADYVPHYVRSI